MSIFAKSTYPSFEIVILDNGEVSPDAVGFIVRPEVMRLPYEQPFNWARAMNQGAARAGGDHLLFVNDDTEVLSPDWLEGLVEFSQLPEIGAVGARLEFPDGRIQHVGVTLLDDIPTHAFYGYPGAHPGYEFSSIVPRNCSAVTGACLMTRSEVFREVGGFTESFALNYNDIDFCLRVRETGRRIVFTPYARLCHHEAATRSIDVQVELAAFKTRWGGRSLRDPYYNPNLSTRFNDYRIESDC
jgi:GT2 family glycosyltransferase